MMTPEQKTTVRGFRFAYLIWFTLIIAAVSLGPGLYLRFYEGGTIYTCKFGGCGYDYNTQWTVGTAMLAWSIAYLVLVGVPYGLIWLLGGGKLRRALRAFWRGDER
jgi:hypothetical protein